MHNPVTRILLNIGHALDHMMLLIFATAVVSISQEFGLDHWEDLMPYSVGAFFFFGLGSIPSGRLGDMWGRRPMMIVFFTGMGIASFLVSMTNSPWQLALALSLLGCMASIYHPVGIPMLVESDPRPGWTIGVNGLAGNLGLAGAAIVTGFLVQYINWRAAFVIPGVVCLVCAVLFAIYTPKQQTAPSKRKKSKSQAHHHGMSMAKLLLIMTIASCCGSMIFNFSVNSNYEMLSAKLAGAIEDPAALGTLLAIVYVTASLTQLIVGKLLDIIELRTLYLSIIVLQCLSLAAASISGGWIFYVLQILFMASIFGAIPFTDSMIVRYVDDSMRSRVAGMRLAISLGTGSLAVWLLGPIVKSAGFTTLLTIMASVTVLTFIVITQLPRLKSATT